VSYFTQLPSNVLLYCGDFLTSACDGGRSGDGLPSSPLPFTTITLLQLLDIRFTEGSIVALVVIDEQSFRCTSTNQTCSMKFKYEM